MDAYALGNEKHGLSLATREAGARSEPNCPGEEPPTDPLGGKLPPTQVLVSVNGTAAFLRPSRDRPGPVCETGRTFFRTVRLWAPQPSSSLRDRSCFFDFCPLGVHVSP